MVARAWVEGETEKPMNVEIRFCQMKKFWKLVAQLREHI